jgi:tryptophan synthase alpha chain
VSRITEAFAKARAEGRTALVCYVMGGDPSVASTGELLEAVDAAGADVIELGLPFSDPIADGPTLQAAATRALRGGATTAKLLALAAGLRLRAPLVAMGYMNPVESFGLQRFANEAARAGICGVILPDLPLEEAQPAREALAARGIELVPLVAPTTGADRAARIAASATGFVYYVSVTGVTGARAALPNDLAIQLRELRALSKVPVVVGFGIATPEQAAQLKGAADGVVVGSAIVALHHSEGVAAVAALVRSLRAALS